MMVSIKQEQSENMDTLETIAAAIKLIDTKKDSLKQAYDDLRSNSALLSSFPLSWSDLDSHFTTVQNSLTNRFRLLQSLSSTTRPELEFPTSLPSVQEPSSSNPPPNQQPPVDSAAVTTPTSTTTTQSPSVPPIQDPSSSKSDPSLSSNPPRPELKALCEKMDGVGLRKYINQHSKDREFIRLELPGAFRFASDPGLMVLDALEGFYGPNWKSKGDKDPELSSVRRSSALLLEILIEMNVNIGDKARERAKKLAFEWKEKARLEGDNTLEALGFLHLVAAYRLGSEFQKKDLVEYFILVAKYRQGTRLCKAIDLGDEVQDLIKKLIDNGKQFLAVKYIFEFELTEKYPPVPLLKAYLRESEIAAKKICKDGKNTLKAQNEATAKEVGAMKAVIKIIEEHKLESEYPKENLEKLIEQLEKQKADRKRPAPAVQPKQQQQSKTNQQKQQQPRNQQQSGNKRPRTTAPVGHPPLNFAGAATSTLSTYQQPHAQPAGLLPEHSAGYLSSTARPYGLVGSTPAAAPYSGASAGQYGLAGTPMGYPENPNHSAPYLYSSESHMPPGYYDRSTAYGGYGVPAQYHPSYYPQ